MLINALQSSKYVVSPWRPRFTLAALVVGVGMIAAGAALISYSFVFNKAAPIDNASRLQPQLDTLDIARDVADWVRIPELGTHIAQAHTVSCDPQLTESLRQWIIRDEHVQGKSVYEIATGTGLLALCAAAAGASQVVGTDVNNMAILNAEFNNKKILRFENCTFVLIDPAESNYFSPPMIANQVFDVILLCQSWNVANGEPSDSSPLASISHDEILLDSIMRQAGARLEKNGQLLLAYNVQKPIQIIENQASELGWSVQRLDDRELETLPAVFSPAMILRLTRNP